jgi:DNA processing protein
VGFNLVRGIGPVRIEALRNSFGDLERAWHASASELRSAGLDTKALESLLEIKGRIDLDFELKRIRDGGFQAVTVQDADYPLRLHEVAQPPALL